MSSQRSLFASDGSFTDADGEESSEGRWSSSQSDDKAVSLSSVPANANHLLLVALLEYVCSLHVTNRRKRDKLFKVLCTQLAQMNIMSPLVAVDELSSVRTQYQQSFATLLHASVNSLKLDGHRALVDPSVLNRKSYFENRLPPLHQPSISLSHMIGFHTSRYSNEYEELQSLGRGAYGSVHKVRHKLDGRCYAVKKVAFQDDTPELWNKTLREVKHLADLNHTSVIRYYTAWLEYQLPNFMAVNNKQKPRTRDDFDLPALTYHHPDDLSLESNEFKSADNNNEHSPEPSTDDSIVFQKSPRKRPPRKYHRTNSWELSGPDGTRSDWYTRPKEGADQSLASGDSALLVHQSYVALYIQMELCCETLQDWLQTRNGTLDSSSRVYHTVEEDMNLYIMKEVLGGVSYLHSQNLIHRDLKPSNIFLNHKTEQRMEVKIGDFGLARQTHTSSSNPGTTTPPMTPAPGIHTDHVLDMSGLILTSGVGTTIYASPEQLAGLQYGSKSDMYSFGLIMFELYQPFLTLMERSKTLTDVRKGALPTEFIERWPLESEFISQLINFNPDTRPSADEMLESRLFHTEQQLIDVMRKTLHQKDKELQKKEQEIHEKDNYIHKLEQQLADKNQELDKLRRLLCPMSDLRS